MPLVETSSSSRDLGVGGTPLMDMGWLSKSLSPAVRLLAKAEWRNPGGSVKDRPALRIVREAERAGRLKPGSILIDATSGNTGIAYSWIGARLGYRVKLAVPASASRERLAILEALGADLVLTDSLEGTDGAIREARRWLDNDPEGFFYADQYNNDANWRAHYDTTAPEIMEQTEGDVTHFVAGLGTGGTFTGTGRRLRELKPSVKLCSVEPDAAFHGIEGLKHMASSIVPGVYDPELADERASVDTESAYAVCRRAARERGTLIGPSGGANLLASLRLAEALSQRGESALVVTILPDSGERYVSEGFWKP